MPGLGPTTPSVPLVVIIKSVLWLICIGLGLWIIFNIAHTLLIFGVAMGITLTLAPLVTTATNWTIPVLRRSLSWSAAVVVVYTLVTLILVTSMVLAVPVVVDQARTIAQDLPQEMPRLQSLVDDWQTRFDRWKLPPKAKANLEEWIHGTVEKLGDVMVRGFALTASGVVNTFSVLLVALAAYLIAIFLLLNFPEMHTRFFAAVPEPYRTDLRGLTTEMNHIFGGFVRGMGILSLAVGVCNFVLLNLVGALASMGVEGLTSFQYTVLVSVLSAIGYLIPIVGVLVTCLVAALLAWFQDPSLTFVLSIVGMLLLGTNAIDRILGPKVMSHAMGVSPLFVVFAAFAGAEIFGFWGMIIGVPAAAMVKSVWIYVYRRFLTAAELPLIHRSGVDPLLEQEKPAAENIPAG